MRIGIGILLVLVTACGRTEVDDQSTSRCETDDDGAVECAYLSRNVWTGLGDLHPREVHHQVPVGTPPEGGFPVVIAFSGSGASGSLSFAGWPGMPFGGLHQAEMVRDLLDAGFAVLCPESHLNGATYWDSNIYGYSSVWELSEDRQFVDDILDEIDAGSFGPLNPQEVFATGISSGGYMTSRLAVTRPDKFAAVAIASASYAWCYSAVCWVPEIEADHPPTMFLHGERDLVVPVSSMQPYADALDDAGVEVEVVIDPEAGHGWIPASGPEVVGWFSRFAHAKAEP